MKPFNTHHAAGLAGACLTFALMLLASCISSREKSHEPRLPKEPTPHEIIALLQDSLQAITRLYDGEIGIAVMTDANDIITANNENKYPMMSVVKLHQAISLCHDFDIKGKSLYAVVTIPRESLNPDTWSPMLKDYPTGDIKITYRDLLRYALAQSDNNASNYLFENVQPVSEVRDSIARIIFHKYFKLSVTEAEMWKDHRLCYENTTSPIGAAFLINRVLTDTLNRIMSQRSRDFIKQTLLECKTGADRIAAPFAEEKDIKVAHKTGSGFRRADGILTAHNDVAFIELPGNRYYVLAVFVKDFKGTEEEASDAIAKISTDVYSAIKCIYPNHKRGSKHYHTIIPLKRMKDSE